jgi:hypothetical protein
MSKCLTVVALVLLVLTGAMGLRNIVAAGATAAPSWAIGPGPPPQASAIWAIGPGAPPQASAIWAIGPGAPPQASAIWAIGPGAPPAR